MSKSTEINLIRKIEEAFKNCKKPSVLSISEQLSDFEYQELMAFSNLSWTDLNSALLEECFEVLNWFSPEAFCFFLPGICIVGVKEQKSDLIIYESIVQMLDRSPNPSYWDTFFVERWTRLDSSQCEAIKEWLLWLSSAEGNALEDTSLNRALETLDFLKEGVTALR